MTRLTRRLIVGLLVLLCSGFALAQQPVQDLGSGSINTSLASWTSSTSAPTCVTPVSNTSQYNSVLVTLIQPSGLTGGVVTFKESLDNSNYFTVQGVQLGTTTIVGPTYTMQASTTAAFLFPLGAAPYFEVCLTTAITGSGTTTVQDALQSFAQAALLAGTQILAAGSNVIGGVTGSGVFEVGPTASANTAANPFFFEPTDGTNGMGAMANFGTSPGAVKSLNINASIMAGTTALVANTWGSATTGAGSNVNASLAIGTTMVSASAPVPVSATAAANTKTNEIFTNLTDHTNSLSAAISALGTAPTGTDVMAVNNVDLPSTASGAAVSTTSLSTTTGTTGTNIKNAAGNLYGIFAINGVASTCWVEFMNSASTGTLGTAPIVSFPLPASTTQPIWIPLPHPINFTTGIAVGTATTNNGSSACGTATALVVQFK